MSYRLHFLLQRVGFPLVYTSGGGGGGGGGGGAMECTGQGMLGATACISETQRLAVRLCHCGCNANPETVIRVLLGLYLYVYVCACLLTTQV